MAIYTPTGLKLRLSIEESFGLMSRVFPKITPFRFLKAIEGLESLPAAFAFIVGVLCFILKFDPFTVGVSTLIAWMVGRLLSLFGIVDNVFLGLGIFYSYFSGYGVFIIIIGIVGLVFSGFKGLVAWFSAKLVGYFIDLFIEWIYTNYVFKKYGFSFTTSEGSFFCIFEYYAFKLNVNPSRILTDEEIQGKSWEITLSHLAENWPMVVERFD